MMGNLNILPDDKYVCPWSNGNNGNNRNNVDAFGQNNAKHGTAYDSLPTSQTVNVGLIIGITGIFLIALFVMFGSYCVYSNINKRRKGDHIVVNDVESDYDNDEIGSVNEDELQLVEV
eukprot:224483_1